MLIDWFTVFAQLVNFLILILLLKHFLYGPIIKAMDERQRKIADRLNESRQARQAAERQAAELAEEKEQFHGSRRQLMEEARRETGQWRDESMAAARREIEEQRQIWLKGLAAEQDSFIKGLKTRMVGRVVELVRKVLADLADSELEARLIAVFFGRLRDEDRQIFLKGHETKALLRTGFALDKRLRQEITSKMRELIPGLTTVDFEHDPALGLGLQLLVGDRRLEWNISRYLRDFEDEMRKAVSIGGEEET